MIKRKLKCIADDGHGWLSVSIRDLATLGIADKISGFSYMTDTRAYLEEDIDAGIYLDAAKAAGWEVTQVYSHSQAYSRLRGLASYCSAWVTNPLKIGREVWSGGNGESYTVESKAPNGAWMVRHFCGSLYKLSKTDPLGSICPNDPFPA